MPFLCRGFVRRLTTGTVAAALAAGPAACGSDSAASADKPVDSPPGTVTVGTLSNGAAKQTDIKVSQVAAIRDELPASVIRSGRLVFGLGALPDSFPPVAFVGSDQQTLTGSELDLARLVAAVLGLKPVVKNSTWENLFVGIDSGKTDIGISNITDTEERKKKYDIASYRMDNVGFEVLASSTWNFHGDYENLAGKTVAVDSGTNQERILLQWRARLRAKGEKLTIKHFPGRNSIYLALYGRKIDAYFGPDPGVVYHVTQAARTANPTRAAGTFSGAGDSLQGLIGAASKKGSGLAKPVADAINCLIRNGQYAKWLAAWKLSNEAVSTSQVNPPGLPLDNS
jgi:polar amino acid transport system substrate-binding protein